MRISNTEALIFDQLVSAAGGELYGLQMVKASNGTLKPGTIYVTLGRMEDKGLVSSRLETNPLQAIPRRLYKVTGLGARTYHAHQSAIAAFASGVQGMAA